MSQSNVNGQSNGNGQTGAIVKGPREKKLAIEKELTASKASLAALLPSHVKPDTMLRSVMAAVSKTPELLMCSPRSIVMATAQACAIGIPPNTPLGLGYLVPFKGECTFIPGYRGLIRLAIQSAEVQAIEARIVYSEDAFEIHMGTDARIDHSPSLSTDRGQIVGVYAVAKLKSGATVFEWMSIGEVNAIRDRSKAATSGPWVTDWPEMAKKSVVRRLCKMLPLSEEKLGRALELQAAAEAGVPDFSDVLDVVGEVVDPETGEVYSEAQPQKPTRAEEMKDRVAQKAAQ